jgi:hypothetical protein
MPNVRSRNYPSLNLADAIDRARVLYKKEGRAKASADVVVSAWGYRSLNGASLRVLSALRQYGLLEGGNEDTRLSERALTLILEPENTEAYSSALVAAFESPALFQEIVAEFKKDLPSDAALISYLVRRQNFNEGAARTLIQSLRASSKHVDAMRALYATDYEIIDEPVISEQKDQPKIINDRLLSSGQVDRKLEFSSGNIVATFVIHGGSAAKADVDLMSLWLKLAEATILAAVDVSAPPAPEDRMPGAENTEGQA